MSKWNMIWFMTKEWTNRFISVPAIWRYEEELHSCVPFVLSNYFSRITGIYRGEAPPSFVFMLSLVICEGICLSFDMPWLDGKLTFKIMFDMWPRETGCIPLAPSFWDWTGGNCFSFKLIRLWGKYISNISSSTQ